MNVRREELPGCILKLHLSFEAGEVDAAFSKVYTELSTRGSVRGFRPGKAPRVVLRRQFGEDTIRNSAWVELLQEHVESTLEDLDILGQPEWPEPEDVQFAEGTPAELEITLTVGPRVTLGPTEGLELYRPSPEATESDVDEIIARLCESHAEEIETERTQVQDGDAVDLELLVSVQDDDSPAEPVDQTLIVGKGTHFPPVGDELLGKSVGDVVEMDVTYPEDYHDVSLAAKAAHVKATVKALRERKVPELTDEFARKVDEEKFTTVDDLRAEAKRQTDREMGSYSRQELENQVVKLLLDTSQIDLPEVLVDSLARQETTSLTEELESHGMVLDEFHDIAGVTAEEFELAQRRRARRLLMIQTIAEQLGKDLPETTEEEIDAEIERYAQEQNLDATFVRQAAALQEDFGQRMAERVARRKAFDRVIEAAQIQDVGVDEYRQMRSTLLKPQSEEPQETAQAQDETASAEQEQREPAQDSPSEAVGVQSDEEAEPGASSAEA